MQELIQAGDDLAEFAHGVAADAIDASGDVMDGSYATALACAWHESKTAATRGAASVQKAAHQLDSLDFLIDILLTLAPAAATMACWIEDDCEDDDELDEDDASEAAEFARIALAQLSAWQLAQAGQQQLAPWE